MLGEEARPAEVSAATAEKRVEEAPPMMETPEGISLTPGEELIPPESESALELEKEPEESKEAVEEDNP